MAKKLFYSMGEVSEMFDVNPSLIRHWESKFEVLKPQKNKKEFQSKRKADKISPGSKRQKESVGVGANGLI